MDQKTVLELVLGVLVPALVAVYAAFKTLDANQKVWLKFVFAAVGAVIATVLLGQFTGVKAPGTDDPVAFIAFLGDISAKVFALAVVLFNLLGERVQAGVTSLRNK